ncbi:hypothetical protein HYT57_04635 [Candidatus Woesearchaeota archaeon]|nr:hypothetical protein [Candidatus Woesearchaeota archaeon]
MITDDLNPIQKFKRSLSGLMDAMNMEDARYASVRGAYLGVEEVFNSDEFRNFRLALRDISAVALGTGKKDGNILIQEVLASYTHFLNDWISTYESIMWNGEIRAIVISDMHTRLQALEDAQEVIDYVLLKKVQESA